MNKAPFLRGMALLMGFALTLSACGTKSDQGNASSGQPPLAGARIGGAFTLTDQDGKTVHWSDFRGKYRLVYFGYTYCPDVCPVDLQKIMAGFRKFEKAAPERAKQVQPIFITVDPERDTPAVLKTWVAAFHPRLIGLTGSSADIEQVKKDFAVVSSSDRKPGQTDYLVSHTRTPYLFGPDGTPIALVPVAEPGSDKDEGSPELVKKFLDQWVK
jgi:protein SCO1/2